MQILGLTGRPHHHYDFPYELGLRGVEVPGVKGLAQGCHPSQKVRKRQVGRDRTKQGTRDRREGVWCVIAEIHYITTDLKSKF